MGRHRHLYSEAGVRYCSLIWNLGVFVFIRYSAEDGVSQSRQEVFIGGPSQAANSPEKEVIVS